MILLFCQQKIREKFCKRCSFPQALDSLMRQKHFLGLLLAKRRLGIFDEILESFRLKWQESRGFHQATVYSAKDLSEKDLDQIKKRLEQVENKKVFLEFRKEPHLLGGLCVDTLGRRINNSVFSRLSRLKESVQKIRRV